MYFSIPRTNTVYSKTQRPDLEPEDLRHSEWYNVVRPGASFLHRPAKLWISIPGPCVLYARESAASCQRGKEKE